MKNPEVLACCLLLTLAGPALATPGNVTVHGAVPPITWPESWPGLLTLADLDGDGRVDVIAAHYFAVNIWR